MNSRTALQKSLSILKGKIKKEKDYISPTIQHLLAITLNTNTPVDALEPRNGSLLRHGYHLSLFPSRIHTSDLAKDGYDQDFSPPHPFLRRMWAGGEFTWNTNNPLLIGQQVHQTTRVKDIKEIYGPDSNDSDLPKSIFVSMEKQIENQFGWSVRETRTLVYLDQDSHAPRSRLPPQVDKRSDFSSHFTPDLLTLFRYSALTFNSHLIHYDKTFATGHDGYSNCLVHGPLTVTLLLQMLVQNLPRDRQLQSLSYRATSPLVVDEEILLAGRKAQSESNMYEVWATNSHGGLGMKGTAYVI